MKLIAETCIIGGSYILISASLIAFNKYLMTFAKLWRALTDTMLMTSVMSLLLYTAAPSLYPTMGKARENWRALSEP